MNNMDHSMFLNDFNKAFNLIKDKDLVSEKSRFIVSGIEPNKDMMKFSPKRIGEKYRKERNYKGMNLEIAKALDLKEYISFEDCLFWAELCIFACNIEAAFILYDHVFNNLPEELIELYLYSFDKYRYYYDATEGFRFNEISNEIINDTFWIDMDLYGMDFALSNKLNITEEDLDVYINREERMRYIKYNS